MTLTSFVEERLELGALYGTDGGPQFRTTIVSAYSGYEERNADWEYEGGSWTLGAYRVNRAGLDYVKDFFRARRGRAVGFRWKNYGNYVMAKTDIGTGDDAETDFQIVRVVDTGYGEPYSWPVKKPVGGTVTVYVDDVVTPSGWTLDTTTGVLTFGSPPADGAVIAVQCEYDMAVRFDTDHLQGIFKAVRMSDGEVVFEIAGLPIVEDKFP